MHDTTFPDLNKIHSPDDLKHLDLKTLNKLAKQLRAATIQAVSKTGGHLGAGLGVVELTIALHHVFNTPHDRLIWDVGHQTYPHKILTGRHKKIHTLRQGGGLSGFTSRSESHYDPFGAAHAGTSVSAGIGFAVAQKLKKQENRHVICVVGDGAMSAGMIYEAMNNAGGQHTKLIIILNDNDMSIAPPTGALSHYLSRTVSSQSYRNLRKAARSVTQPIGLDRPIGKVEKYAREFVMGGDLFESLGFFYLGPIDGHDLSALIPILKNVRKMDNGPVLIHAVTQKGKGYAPAEAAKDKYHGVSRFNLVTGKQKHNPDNSPSYTDVFAEELTRIAQTDEKIVAVTAAMPAGTGLDRFAKKFPERTFDVGIAEQHAVTFCAGLAAEGMKPFAAIYSTFLQRAYDSIIHDVAIQKLPVRFAIDRAGLVGADGPTHAGSFDTAFLGSLPDMVLMAAADEAELQAMIHTACQINDRPCAFRYPRGTGPGKILADNPMPLPIGKGRLLQEGETIALLSYGGRLAETLKAAQMLEAQGLSTSVADARFAKPLDTRLLESLAKHHQLLLTIEEGSQGGFGSFVLQHLCNNDLLNKIKIRTLTLPDNFIPQDTPQAMYAKAGLDAASIAQTAISALGQGETHAPLRISKP